MWSVQVQLANMEKIKQYIEVLLIHFRLRGITLIVLISLFDNTLFGLSLRVKY